MQQLIAKIVIVLLVSLSVNPALAATVASFVQVNYPSLALTDNKLNNVEVIHCLDRSPLKVSIAHWLKQKQAQQVLLDQLIARLTLPFDEQVKQAQLHWQQQLVAIKVQADVFTSLKTRQYQLADLPVRFQAPLETPEHSLT